VQILVTGCAGYIGSIICQTLIQENHSVIGLDNLSTGFRENIPPAVKFYEGDIADITLLKEIKNSHPELNSVIHLAGFIEVAESVKDPEKYFDNNFHKAKLLLDSLEKLNFKNIIFSSTAAVYGIPQEYDSNGTVAEIGVPQEYDSNGTVAEIGVPQEYDSNGTVAERASSRLRRTNDRSVLLVHEDHEDHEDDENAEIGVQQQCHTACINEGAVLAPINPYGSSKLEFEKALQASTLNYIIFRFFNVAGADGVLGECHEPETHLIPLLLDFALGKREDFSIYGNDYPTPDGTAIRDYIHVKDLAQAHLLALETLCNNLQNENITEHITSEPKATNSTNIQGSRNINQIYNLGYGQGFSVKEIVNITEKLINQKINYGLKPRRIGDPAYLVASPEKALRLLGFQPKFNSIETIIKDALEHRRTWYRKDQ
jgi:UDP-glucose 4-epimerase